MTNILIFLPKEFQCFSKFERKLTRITSSLENFQLSSPIDPHDFLSLFATKHVQCQNICIQEDWKIIEYTHVVIFDDGEVFTKEAAFFKEHQIPLRIIPIKVTRVVNIHVNKEFQEIKKSEAYEYIGRGSIWGNPYSMFGDEHESREDVILKFKYDFDRDILMKAKKQDVYKLAGKRLGCFCKPHDCHGDILANFLNSWDDGL